MTGWRIGYSWTDPDVAKKFAALQSQITSNAATPSQVAALAAYSDEDAANASLDEMGAAFRRRRDLVVARLKDLLPGAAYVEPGGAFYLYFRVDGFFDGEVQSATAWCSDLLEQQGVALVPGAAFGDDRWVRLSFATSDEILEEGFRRVGAMVGAISTA
jgi:aspartate aminotransferase